MGLRDDESAKRAFRDAAELRDAGRRYDEALAILQALLSEYQESTAVLGTMAAVLFAAKRFAEARDYFSRVLTLRPNVELASLGLFHCLWAMGDREAARAEVVRFLSDNDSAEYAQLLREMGWRFDASRHQLIEG